MRERGASGNSFDPIVASGPNGAKPHARPTDRADRARRARRHRLRVHRRRVLLRHDPHGERRRSRAAGRAGSGTSCSTSQQAGRDAVAAGVACADVDRACRDVIEAAGLGRRVLARHRPRRRARDPRGAPGRDDGRWYLDAGDVVTVEPGVYLPGVGGVRIEDTVVVTDAGAEPSPSFPKDLSIETAPALSVARP